MAARFEVIKNLRPLHLPEFGQRFQLDDDLFVTNKIGSIWCPEPSAFVKDWHFCLRTEWDPSIAEFKFERLLIDRLKKTTPEFIMNLQSCPDDLIGLIIHGMLITE